MAIAQHSAGVRNLFHQQSHFYLKSPSKMLPGAAKCFDLKIKVTVISIIPVRDIIRKLWLLDSYYYSTITMLLSVVTMICDGLIYGLTLKKTRPPP